MWPWRSWVRAPLLTPFFSAVCRDVGVSPSGKARDFDSRIRKVRILPPQPFDPLAQLVEHLTFNQGAWGSNPQWVTIWGVRVWRNGRRGRLRICCLWRMSSSLFTRTIICGSSSVVECHLAKVDVASSNLVYRSTDCGCSSMAELQPSKLATWVRFPSPAPKYNQAFFLIVGHASLAQLARAPDS